jgi:RimJ/RimL family protein N-acetyltransferase
MYLRIDADARTLGLPPVTEHRINDWLDGLTRDGWSLLARHDGAIIGHVGVTPADDPEPHLVVFLDQEFRNRGIGSELLRQMIAYAGEWGHDALALRVTGDNRRAIDVYDNLGFDVVDRLGAELEMSLSLGDPIIARAKRPPIEWDDQ